MYKVLILIMGVLLGFPTTSLAASWLKNGQAGSVTQNVSPGGFVTNTPALDTEANSPVLFTGSCENIDILYFVDTDGDGTDNTVTVGIRSCPSAAAGDAVGDSDMCWLIENVTLTGAYPTDAIYGAAAGWIFVDTGGTDIGGQEAQQELIVRCNGSGTP
jgi:hypothetical protein